MTKKYLAFLALLIAVIAVTSGCGKKPNVVINQPENNNQENIATTTDADNEVATTTGVLDDEIKYLANGKVDTSNWQSLVDEVWKVKIKYPKNWIYEIFEQQEYGSDYVFTSPNYNPVIQGPVTNLGEIYFHIFKYEKDIPILTMIDWFNDLSNQWPKKFKYIETKINSNPALIFNEIHEAGDNYSRKVIYIKHGMILYSWSYLYEDKDEEIVKILDTMALSMEFGK